MAGSIVGTGAAGSSMYEVQERYDGAYIQCMYAKGHQVPGVGTIFWISTQPGCDAILDYSAATTRHAAATAAKLADGN